MKNIFFALTVIAALKTNHLMAQTKVFVNVGFEELQSEIPVGSVWNGSNGKTKYTNYRGVIFDMNIGWDEAWGGYWKNMWAFSRMNYTKEEPSDFATQLFASKAGAGAEENGEVYAIGAQNTYILNPQPSEQSFLSFYVSNSTYAYNSMKLGDAFAKQFKAEDQDSFVLVVSVFNAGELALQKRIYLAYFGGEDTNKHGLLDTWQLVTLEEAPTHDSIHFELFSSDTGQYGINTPTYFALDNFTLITNNSQEKFRRPEISIFPNPGSQYLQISSKNALQAVQFWDLSGKQIYQISQPSQTLNTEHLAAGWYGVKITDEFGNVSDFKWLKQYDQ
jgi:hypothetical protein